MTEAEIEARFDALQQKIAQLEDEAREREVKQLKMGVRVMGVVVLAMAGWIWTQIGHIFDYAPRGSK